MGRASETVEDLLRRRVLGLLHSGRLKAGERLPSIRQISRQTGHDHRAVAAAFRRLEREGLVEVRAGSGVYVQADWRGTASEDQLASWTAEVLMEGWNRLTTRKEIGETLRRVGTARVRCGLIESNLDHMAAFGEELRSDFLVEVEEILVSPESTGSDVDRAAVGRCTMVCTSAFHRDLAAPLATEMNIPVVVLTVSTEYATEIDRLLSERPLTAVAVDPGYGARAAAHLAVSSHRDRGRFVTVDRMQESGVRADDPDVLLTLAARRRLGLEEYHLIPPPPRLISPDSARAVMLEIARCGLRR